MSNQAKPTPSSGGNLKYILLGLLFLGGAFGIAFYANQSPQAAPAPAPAPASAERINPMAEPTLDLEAPEGPPDAAVPQEPAKTAKSGAGRKGGGEWSCSGDLAGASKVIGDNRAQIRSCYERRLKVNNILQGDIRLKLKVGANGKVVATSVAGSINDQEVFACVRSLAQSWTFAAPTGGNCAVIQVPFQFSPKNP